MADTEVEDKAPEVPLEAPEAINIVQDSGVPENLDNVPKLTYPGMIDKVLTELHRLTAQAQQGTDAVGIDKAAQKLADELEGCYGPDIAEMFSLPTLDRLVELGIAEVVDWDRGKTLAVKVASYVALAEDFGLSPEQVTGLNDTISEWENYLPKGDRVHQAKRDHQRGDGESKADIPFAVRISFGGKELGRYGEQTGSMYWSQTWNGIQNNHWNKELGKGEKFSPVIREAMKAGKAALLGGAKSVQVGDYIVDRL